MYLNYKSIIEEFSLRWIIADLKIKLKAQYVTWKMHFFLSPLPMKKKEEVEMFYKEWEKVEWRCGKIPVVIPFLILFHCWCRCQLKWLCQTESSQICLAKEVVCYTASPLALDKIPRLGITYMTTDKWYKLPRLFLLYDLQGILAKLICYKNE